MGELGLVAFLVGKIANDHRNDRRRPDRDRAGGHHHWKLGPVAPQAGDLDISVLSRGIPSRRALCEQFPQGNVESGRQDLAGGLADEGRAQG